jgi:uncharacterized membrane protein
MTDNLTEVLQGKLSAQQGKLARRTRLNIRLLRNWYAIVVAFLALYVGLPFAAPILMKVGATGPANVVYTIYSPLCHQFSFRSVFLFGEQAVYPRQNAEGRGDLRSFEEAASQSDQFVALFTEQRKKELDGDGQQTEAETYVFKPGDLNAWTAALQTSARKFRGDEQMGYKVALCERDIAIYLAMVVGGIAYGFVHRRLRPCPIWLYLLLGIAPLALDGFSQLLSYPPFELWEVRETAPGFRFLTGALFGLMNVWLAFPYINLSMQESIRQLTARLQNIDRQIAGLGSQN